MYKKLNKVVIFNYNVLHFFFRLYITIMHSIYIYIFIHTYIHTYKHTYIHTDTHIM